MVNSLTLDTKSPNAIARSNPVLSQLRLETKPRMIQRNLKTNRALEPIDIQAVESFLPRRRKEEFKTLSSLKLFIDLRPFDNRERCTNIDCHNAAGNHCGVAFQSIKRIKKLNPSHALFF